MSADAAVVWKAVLGENPTGVVLITSVGDGGDPVAMVVGTFTAVSQDPPLIGFFPDRSSTTLPHVVRHGSFCASVLGTSHEGVARAFARKDPDRWDTATWVRGTSGASRPADALAWFEADITSVTPAGDHDLVLGAVTAFGTGDGDAGLPLLHRRGGYGTFAVPGADVEAGDLTAAMVRAGRARAAVDACAPRIGRRIVVSATVGSSVVTLATTDLPAGGSSAPLPGPGSSFPFAAPMAAVFAAWGSEERRTTWIENSRHLLGSVDRPALATLLADVRSRGFAVSTGAEISRDFTALLDDETSGRASFAALWRRVAQQNVDTSTARPLAGVTSLQVPVFGEGGDVDLALVVEFPAPADAAVVEAVAAQVRSCADQIASSAPQRPTASRP